MSCQLTYVNLIPVWIRTSCPSLSILEMDFDSFDFDEFTSAELFFPAYQNNSESEQSQQTTLSNEPLPEPITTTETLVNINFMCL